jgi:4-hydroxybutyryl-CoA dehydratase/vinylacetyl-CoA-Delta-isomerase
MSELAYGAALGSAALCSQTPCGSYVPNSMYVNAAKIQGIKSVYRAGEIAAEVAGGLVCTMPSQKDFENPKLGPVLDKYLKARDDISARDRVKLLRFIEYLMGQGSVIPAESLLGGGAPAACRVMIKINSNMKYNKKCVQKPIDIKEFATQ